jgi:hypothetical protein
MWPVSSCDFAARRNPAYRRGDLSDRSQEVNLQSKSGRQDTLATRHGLRRFMCGRVCGLRNLISGTSARAARDTSERLGMHGDRSTVAKPPEDWFGPTTSWGCVSDWGSVAARALRLNCSSSSNPVASAPRNEAPRAAGFAEEQESRSALLLVVHRDRLGLALGDARCRRKEHRAPNNRGGYQRR